MFSTESPSYIKFLVGILILILLANISLNIWMLTVLGQITTTSSKTSINLILIGTIIFCALIFGLILFVWNSTKINATSWRVFFLTCLVFLCLVVSYISTFFLFNDLDISEINKNNYFNSFKDYILITMLMHVILFVMYIIFFLYTDHTYDPAKAKEAEIKELVDIRYKLDQQEGICVSKCKNETNKKLTDKDFNHRMIVANLKPDSPEFKNLYDKKATLLTKKEKVENPTQPENKVKTMNDYLTKDKLKDLKL